MCRVSGIAALCLTIGVSCATRGWAQPNVRYETTPNPYLFLLREPAVHEELRLTDQQRAALLAVHARFDGPLLALRTAPAEKANQLLSQILSGTQQEVAAILNRSQQQRVAQLLLRTRGIACLQGDGVAEQLQLSAEQRQQIAAIIDQTAREIQRLDERAPEGVTREALDKEYTRLREREQEALLGLLAAPQRTKLSELRGPPFDTSRLGHVRFQPPELVEATGWINSPPVRIADLKGRVIALHFWTFGCANCIRNYPAYANWQQSFANRGLAILGIHTPEREAERNVDAVRAKVKEAGFDFPVVVDNERSNWTAWGNGIWPSVYLIDKRGYLRYWWYGELKWQGTDGEKIMRSRIEQLLAE